MPDLVLGVLDIPYADEGVQAPPRLTKKGKLRKATAQRIARAYQAGGGADVVTTGDVAQQLEEKYHVMETWVDANRDAIMAACVHGMEGALADLFAGASPRDPYAGFSQEVADGFKVWLGLGLIEELGIPGVPTKAAIERRSMRFKSKKGPAQRPSFVDTGNYEGAVTAWVEG